MNIENNYSTLESKVLSEDKTLSKKFMANVFIWMFAGLIITASVAWMFAYSSLLHLLITETGLSTLGWIVMFSPFVMVIFMSFGFNKMSFFALMTLFLVYSALMGASLSFILLIYTAQTIALTFLITAAMFGAMAIAGYTTKIDLTKFGSIMFMALIGLVIAIVVNLFMKSSGLQWIISCAGVLIFTGLTAWDVQRMKKASYMEMIGTETGNKMALMGALSLYLNFINLFLFLLRLIGGRN
ncbi:MAG: Bax inhibitor-1/YccA family protein [Bacteroidales bacterium]|jgi:FtsH-binding integral membrane protein|nr:Bax inhibitor-1/YccA family protein [Bacteroidales bacterium]MDD2688123.1 Bax inhibitor-1/YccA family protein [Bacteroidales bacterium]MDD3330399.1 Bax inhibitor-1/YccA family protein [Bacteroidales bacterium]MDD3690903.1 Bax inhibitor-1/YccA family protein [Bacteroidales bacterium]MDD4044388.1 Bax inhibitor-1/YccA family protein [Bacteroidales bacterium]